MSSKVEQISILLTKSGTTQKPHLIKIHSSITKDTES